MSNEKYNEFEANLNILSDNLRAMKTENGINKEFRDNDVFLDGPAAAWYALKRIHEYYASTIPKKGETPSAFSQHIKEKVEKAQEQYKEMREIASKNSVDAPKAPKIPKSSTRKDSTINLSTSAQTAVASSAPKSNITDEKNENPFSLRELEKSPFEDDAVVTSPEIKAEKANASSAPIEKRDRIMGEISNVIKISLSPKDENAYSNIKTFFDNQSSATLTTLRTSIDDTFDIIKKGDIENKKNSNLPILGQIEKFKDLYTEDNMKKFIQINDIYNEEIFPQHKAELAKIIAGTEPTGNNFQDLAMKPVQYAMRFKDLLTELQKHTPQDHKDYQRISTLLVEFTKIAQDLNAANNQKKLVQENKENLAKLDQKLRGGLGTSTTVSSEKINADIKALRESLAQFDGKPNNAIHDRSINIAKDIATKIARKTEKPSLNPTEISDLKIMLDQLSAVLYFEGQSRGNADSTQEISPIIDKVKTDARALFKITEDSAFTRQGGLIKIAPEIVATPIPAVQDKPANNRDIDAQVEASFNLMEKTAQAIPNAPLPAFDFNFNDLTIPPIAQPTPATPQTSAAALISAAKVPSDITPSKFIAPAQKITLEDTVAATVQAGVAGEASKSSPPVNEAIVQKSNEFFKIVNGRLEKPLPDANRIENLIKTGAVTPEEVVKDAENSGPIIHTQVDQLITDFVEYKRTSGSDIEKALYANMTREEFLDRLLTKRPLVFTTGLDNRLLKDGTRPVGDFENIGTPLEKPPLALADYLSYDEMKVSALLAIASPTHFINKGDRNNDGKPDPTGNYEKRGIYVGLVGARFEKSGQNEYQQMIITRSQNSKENGYGANGNKVKAAAMAPFAKFYRQKHFSSFEGAEKDKNGKFINVGKDKDGNNIYLDKEIYKQRMRMVFEPHLDDVNARAQAANTQAYLHAVGIGLGVWAEIGGPGGPRIDAVLGKLQVEVYRELLQEKNYQNISNVNFSWFPDECKNQPGVSNPIGNTKIEFSRRNPADPLVGEDKGKLLVAQYAWDGNSFSGNEYFLRDLHGSGEPAAASCSTITELQNPLINKAINGKNVKSYGAPKPALAEKAANKDEIAFRKQLAEAFSTMKGMVSNAFGTEKLNPGDRNVDKANLSKQISEKASLQEKLNLLEAKFKEINTNRPLNKATMEDIKILKNLYVNTVVTTVQNVGDHQKFTAELESELKEAKNSPLVKFRNTNLPLISKHSGTRKAINYVNNHKDAIADSYTNRAAQVLLLADITNKHVSKIINENLIKHEEEQKTPNIEKISNKNLKEMPFNDFYTNREDHPNAWKAFEDHLKKEFAVESTNFLEAHENFLKEPTKARYDALYDKFIAAKAEEPINITAQVRGPLDAVRVAAPYDESKAIETLNTTANAIKSLLGMDNFVRFKGQNPNLTLQTLLSKQNLDQKENLSKPVPVEPSPDTIMAKGTVEHQEWVKKYEEEFNKPARPTQPLPLTKEDQTALHNLELKAGKAMSDLRFAVKDPTNAGVLTQALKKIQIISTEINTLKSETKGELLKEKLSQLNKGLHDYVTDSQKKVGNSHIAKPEQPKPVEENKPLIDATPSKPSQQIAQPKPEEHITRPH